jgi:hypothetical protein
LLRLPWRLLRGVLLVLAAAVLFIEEWGWRPLTAFVARLAKWPPLARLEASVRAAPPRVALLLFLLPAVALFPIKLFALWIIHRGHALLGITVIIVAKLLGTAIVGRLFILTESQLMRFAWFARALMWWRATKQRVMDALRRSAAWRAARRLKTRWRAWRRRWRGLDEPGG